MEINIIDLLNKKFFRSTFESQKGSSPILFVTIISAASFFLASTYQKSVTNTHKVYLNEIEKYNLKNACEESLDLVSSLLGSGVLSVKEELFGSVKKLYFVPNPFVEKSDDYGVRKQDYWSVDPFTGQLIINNCLYKNSFQADKLKEIFIDGETSILTKIEKCYEPTDEVINTITPIHIVTPTDSANSYLTGNYIIVQIDCQKKDDSKKILQTKFAQVKFLPVSQTCDFAMTKTSRMCSLDHCRYMKPLKIDDKLVLDKQFEKTYIPNPDYIETLTIDRAIPNIDPELDNFENIPNEQTQKFKIEGLCPNYIHPFKGWQAIDGNIETYPLAEYTFDGKLLVKISTEKFYENNQTAISSDFSEFNLLQHPSNSIKHKFITLIKDAPLGSDNLALGPIDNEEFVKNPAKYSMPCNSVGAIIPGCDGPPPRPGAVNLCWKYPDFCSLTKVPIAQMFSEFPKIRMCTIRGPIRFRGANLNWRKEAYYSPLKARLNLDGKNPPDFIVVRYARGKVEETFHGVYCYHIELTNTSIDETWRGNGEYDGQSLNNVDTIRAFYEYADEKNCEKVSLPKANPVYKNMTATNYDDNFDWKLIDTVNKQGQVYDNVQIDGELYTYGTPIHFKKIKKDSNGNTVWVFDEDGNPIRIDYQPLGKIRPVNKSEVKLRYDINCVEKPTNQYSKIQTTRQNRLDTACPTSAPANTYKLYPASVTNKYQCTLIGWFGLKKRNCKILAWGIDNDLCDKETLHTSDFDSIRYSTP